MTKLYHYIGGKKMAGTSGRFGSVYNPSTGEESASCPYASTEEVNNAVELADKAAMEWKKVSVGKRMEVFFSFRSLLVATTEELAIEIGKEKWKNDYGCER